VSVRLRLVFPVIVRVFRLVAWAGIPLGIAAVPLHAQETNARPVEAWSAPPAGSWNVLGPFLFSRPTPDKGRISGFRPLYVQRAGPDGEIKEATALYPLFIYRGYGDNYRWSLFSLVNRYGRRPGAPPPERPEEDTTEVWPFYFHRETGDASTSYMGIFPIAGEAQGHLGYESIRWCLFPLYAKTRKAGAVTLHTPWPVVRTTSGSEEGIAVWPLFGRLERPGEWTRTFILWPLAWNNTIQAGDGAPRAAPRRQVGFLPFYTSDRGPGGEDVNVLWPFFGVTDRTAPNRYHETRYLWPFLVQGAGDGRSVSRYAPFYTHSVHKGVDKTWILWPLWRRLAWTDSGLLQEKTQLFYFVGMNMEQRSSSRPDAAPARKTFLWPLYSGWDNGAGRRQFQFPAIFDVFFPDNADVRESWTPLATLARHEETPDGVSRTSILWNALTCDRRPAGGRVALFGGLLGLKRGPGGGWRPFCMEFSADTNIKRPVAK
jgi:hypothetical protein